MGQLRDRMMHELELAGYAPKTRPIYLSSIRDVAEHHRRSPPRPAAASHRGPPTSGRVSDPSWLSLTWVSGASRSIASVMQPTEGDDQG